MAETGDLSPGTRLHKRYLIRERVAKGGMGCVYRAEDISNNHKEIAIKEMSREKGVQQLFHQEAAFLRSLSHPSLPRFYDLFAEGKHTYIVMDFIPGKTLATLIDEAPNYQLRVEQVVLYAMALCNVLAYLHERSQPIVFRDLKPSNVIISPDDKVFLVDFGIARIFKAKQSKDTMAFGSKGYCAPEALDEKQTEPRSDLYSLGATLHHCLTGIPPSTAGYSPLAPVSTYNPHVPQRLDALISKLLRKFPKDRPPDASSAYAEFKRVLQEIRFPSIKLLKQPRTFYEDTTHPILSWQTFPQLLLIWCVQLGLITLNACNFVWLWFQNSYLPFCGNVVRYLVKSIKTGWSNLKDFAGRSSSPKQPKRSGAQEKPWQVVQKALKYAVPVPHQWLVPTPFPVIARFSFVGMAIGLFAYTLIELRQDLPWLLFALILLLVMVSLLTYLRRDISDRTRNVVSIQLVTSGTLAVFLLLQPHALSTLSSLTVSQMLEMAIMVLVVAAFLQREGSSTWLERALIVVLAGVQTVLFAFDIWLPIVLAIGTGLILLCIRVRFSLVDRLAILTIMGLSLWQWWHQDMHLQVTGPTSTVINGVLAVITVFITLILLRMSIDNAYLLRVVFGILAFINLTLLQRPHSIRLGIQMNWVLVGICALIALSALVSLLIYRGRRETKRNALFYSVLLLIVSVICILVQISLWQNMDDLRSWYDSSKELIPLPIVNEQLLSAMPQTTILFVRVTMSLFALILFFIFISSSISLVRLVRRNSEDENSTGALQRGKEMGKHFLLLTTVITCLLVQEFFGQFEPSRLLYQSNPLTTSHVLLIVLAALALILLVKFLRRSRTAETWFWERIAILVMAIAYALLLASVRSDESVRSGKSVLPVMLPVLPALDLPQSSVYLLLCGLCIVATLPLVTLNVTCYDAPPWLIRLIISVACVCALLSLFWPPILVGAFICLIQGLFLINNNHRIESW
jgi:serine/threonine protein kinase